MKLNEKLQIISQAITSLATHSDEDAAVREAALDRVSEMLSAHKANIKAEIERGIKAALSPTA